MMLVYIKANGIYYQANETCLIKKLWFGRWQVDYFDYLYLGDTGKPNMRVILYPSGIEEIKFII